MAISFGQQNRLILRPQTDMAHQEEGLRSEKDGYFHCHDSENCDSLQWNVDALLYKKLGSSTAGNS